MRRIVRRDANHATLVADLRAAGYTVEDLGAVGRGVPDLLVGAHGISLLVEVKHPDRLNRKRGATQAATDARQLAWRETWHGGPVVVATCLRDVDEALIRQLGERPPFE